MRNPCELIRARQLYSERPSQDAEEWSDRGRLAWTRRTVRERGFNLWRGHWGGRIRTWHSDYVLHTFQRPRADAITKYYSKRGDKWRCVNSTGLRATQAVRRAPT